MAILRHLVNDSVTEQQYDYRPNKLKITQLIFSRTPLPQSNNKYELQLSYVVSFCYILYFANFVSYLEKIPDMYQCILLKDKYLRIRLLTSSEKESNLHPTYKLTHNETLVDSKLIRVEKYTST